MQTQLRSGKSLSDVAKDKGVSEQDLRSAVAAAAKTQLDQAVKDGKLTQAQADSMLQRIQQGPLGSSATDRVHPGSTPTRARTSSGVLSQAPAALRLGQGK